MNQPEQGLLPDNATKLWVTEAVACGFLDQPPQDLDDLFRQHGWISRRVYGDGRVEYLLWDLVMANFQDFTDTRLSRGEFSAV